MKCDKCKEDFLEKEIELSHDVPCYLFLGNRTANKNRADKFGRHYLCKRCHQDFENNLNLILKAQAIKFGERFFKNDS